jgi:hypothetical protein
MGRSGSDAVVVGVQRPARQARPGPQDRRGRAVAVSAARDGPASRPSEPDTRLVAKHRTHARVPPQMAESSDNLRC